MHYYEIRFKGSWLGGKAIVRANDCCEAWRELKRKYISLEPIEKCKIKLLDDDPVLYIDDGDY